jgi:hypothetical protein
MQTRRSIASALNHCSNSVHYYFTLYHREILIF